MSREDWDRRFAVGYAAVTAPMVASAAVAPSPAAWAGAWTLVAAAAVVNREFRIRARAARPAPPRLTAVVDSAACSVQDRTAA